MAVGWGWWQGSCDVGIRGGREAGGMTRQCQPLTAGGGRQGQGPGRRRRGHALLKRMTRHMLTWSIFLPLYFHQLLKLHLFIGDPNTNHMMSNP